MESTKLSDTIRSQGLIPIFSHNEFDTCRGVMMACYEAGIRVFEFTNRGDFSPGLFARLSEYASNHAPDLRLGAGSVVDADMAAQYMKSGAEMIVSPLLNQAVAEACAKEQVLWIPGCATLTEVARATELGADIVKVFPGNVLGPEFIKAVLAPCPWFSLMPTGGVTADKDNLSGWFNAGAVAVGMGSQLINKTLVAQQDYDQIREYVKAVLKTINELRSS